VRDPLHIAGDAFLKTATRWLASRDAEHLTDLVGLGGMALSSADKLRSAFRKPDEEQGSVVGGDAGRTGMDLGALGLMAAPSAAALHHLATNKATTRPLAGGGSKLTNAVNLASLAALMAPGVDKLQAKLRGGDDKRLMSDRTHEALEVAGLGGLAGGVAGGMWKDRSARNLAEGSALLAGYGTLAAPAVHGLVHPHHAEPADPAAPAPANPDAGHWKKPLSEIAGLSLLAVPSIAHAMARGPH